MSKEAMKLALALATIHHTDDEYPELRQKVRRLAKEALAEQPAPVTWTPEDGLRPQDIRVEMYPPQPTSGMIVGMSKGVRLTHTPTGTVVECDTERSQHRNRDVALKKLEAALNASLAEKPAQQEPINKYCCHLCFNKSGHIFLDRMILCPECGNKRCPKATHHELPCTNSNELGQQGSMYTSPPAQRTWVGLTEEEIKTSLPYSVTRDKGCFHAGALWAEAKLKEKNT